MAAVTTQGSTQPAAHLLERAARRVRSAEALVDDLRLALDQEVARAIDTTALTLADIARVCGASCQDVYGALERADQQALADEA